MTPSTGDRLRCTNCGAELIIIGAQAPELTCCGLPLVDVVNCLG